MALLPSSYSYQQRRRTRCFAAILAALSLLFAACGNSGDDSGDDAAATTATTAGNGGGTTVTTGDDEQFVPVDAPGVTDDEIDFAAFGTQANNPLGTCVLDCYTQGIEAYFAFRNDQGGVHGRQLVLKTKLDDELSNNQQRALDIISANDTFAAFSATQFSSGWGDIANAGIPLYTWSIDPAAMTGKDSIFGYTGVLCTGCTSRAPVYAGTLVHATTVAALGYGISPNSKDCADGSAASVEEYSDDTGQTVGFTDDNLDFGLPNGIGPQVTQMKDAGVDYIIGCLDLNGMKTLAQELARQGMGDVPMYHPNTYDAAFVKEAGELFEGDIVSVTFRPFEADAGDSQLADFTEWMGKAGNEPSELALVGWVNADLAYQGLVAAGPDFSRESVIAATNQMTDFTGGGLIPPIDWTNGHEAPTEEDRTTHGGPLTCTSLVQVEGGEFHLVGDPAKPFLCWDNTNRDWAEPTDTNFG